MVDHIYKDVTEAITDLKELSVAGDSQDASMCVVVLISETKKLLDHCSQTKELQWLEKVYSPVILTKFKALSDQAKVLTKETAPALVKGVKDMEITIIEMMTGIRNPDLGPPEYREALERGSEIIRLLKDHMIASVKKRGGVEKNLMKVVMELKELLGLWFKSKTLKPLLPNHKDRFLQLLATLAKSSQKLDQNTKQEDQLEEAGSTKALEQFQKGAMADYNNFYETITKLGDLVEEWLGKHFNQKMTRSSNILYEVKSNCLARLRGEDVPDSVLSGKDVEADEEGPIFNEKRMEEYQDMFNCMRGESETVPGDLFADIARVVGFNPTKAEIVKAKKEFGKNAFTFEDFCDIIKKGEGWFKEVNMNDILVGFMSYDRNETGFITSGQFQDLLNAPIAENFTKEEAQNIMENLGINPDPDADISYLIEIASSIVYARTWPSNM